MKRNTFIGKTIGRLAAAAVSAVMIASSLSFGASAQTFDTKYGTKEIESSSWMSALPDDIKISDMSIPGAHDASTRNVIIGMGHFAQTQYFYINELLEIGVRYFDLRVCCDDNGVLYMCHGKVNCYNCADCRMTLGDALADMRNFLRDHPSETILLQVKCDRYDNNAQNETWNFLKDMADGGELYYGDHVPTLGEVRGKMYLFSRLDFGETTQKDKFMTFEDGNIFKFRSWGIDVHNFSGGNTEEKTLDETAYGGVHNCVVNTEDMYDVPKAEKWEYVYNSLVGPHNAAYYSDAGKDVGLDTFNIIYASMSYQNWYEVALRVIHPFYNLFSDREDMVWPKEGADYINPKLRALLEHNPTLYTGCLVCDYIDRSLSQDIYMTNFIDPADCSFGYTGSW